MSPPSTTKNTQMNLIKWKKEEGKEREGKGMEGKEGKRWKQDRKKEKKKIMDYSK